MYISEGLRAGALAQLGQILRARSKSYSGVLTEIASDLTPNNAVLDDI